LVGLGTAGVVGGLLFASGDSLLQGWRTDKLFLVGYLMGPESRSLLRGH